jgi:hypothetical protein
VCSLLQCLVVLGLPESLPLNGDHGAARDTRSVHLAQLPKLEQAGASMALPPATLLFCHRFTSPVNFTFHHSMCCGMLRYSNSLLPTWLKCQCSPSFIMRRAAELCTVHAEDKPPRPRVAFLPISSQHPTSFMIFLLFIQASSLLTCFMHIFRSLLPFSRRGLGLDICINVTSGALILNEPPVMTLLTEKCTKNMIIMDVT